MLCVCVCACEHGVRMQMFDCTYECIDSTHARLRCAGGAASQSARKKEGPTKSRPCVLANSCMFVLI